MADEKTPPPAPAAAPEKVQKFRVLHAAVSGIKPDPKTGKDREHDYYNGTILTEKELGGQADQYIAAGAVALVD